MGYEPTRGDSESNDMHLRSRSEAYEDPVDGRTLPVGRDERDGESRVNRTELADNGRY